MAYMAKSEKDNSTKNKKQQHHNGKTYNVRRFIAGSVQK